VLSLLHGPTNVTNIQDRPVSVTTNITFIQDRQISVAANATFIHCKHSYKTDKYRSQKVSLQQTQHSYYANIHTRRTSIGCNKYHRNKRNIHTLQTFIQDRQVSVAISIIATNTTFIHCKHSYKTDKYRLQQASSQQTQRSYTANIHTRQIGRNKTPHSQDASIHMQQPLTALGPRPVCLIHNNDR